MVELVRHALVDGTVGLDVNNITNLESTHIGGKLNVTLLAKVAREHVASASA